MALAYRPSTGSAQDRHFRTFCAFLIFMRFPLQTTVYNLLVFLEYLYTNNLSPKVIQNYLSCIRTVTIRYNLQAQYTNSHLLTSFIGSISTNSSFAPTPRGIFDIKTIYHIFRSCDALPDPHLSRAIFFYALLCLSENVQHSPSQ